MKTALEIFGLNRRATTDKALGELKADIARSPRENLRARRDRINRQREARMYRDAEAAAERERAGFDEAMAHERWDEGFGA